MAKRDTLRAEAATLLAQADDIDAQLSAMGQSSDQQGNTCMLQFDGGSRGNPGPAGAGAVICSVDSDGEAGKELWIGRVWLGERTNNYAEYSGLICGLKAAQKLAIPKLVIQGDSTLVVKQIRGEYRVKEPTLKILHKKATQLLENFEDFRIDYIPRAENSRADGLANEAMDKMKSGSKTLR